MHIIEVKARLSAWGRWVAMNDDTGIGYAHQSVIHRVMVEGPEAACIRTTNKSTVLTVPDDIATIDRIVSRLDEEHRALIKFHYTVPGKNKWTRTNLKKPRYFKLLDQAHWMIGGALQLVETNV